MESYIKERYEEIITNEHRAYSFSFIKREIKDKQILNMLETTTVALESWLKTQLFGSDGLINSVVNYSKDTLNKKFRKMEEDDLLKYSIYLTSKVVKIDIYINRERILKKEFKRINDEQT